MRLTLHTDYALRVLVHAGLNKDRLVTINEIAEAHRISKNHLTKVVLQLAKDGFIKTVRGKKGGMRLAVRPQDIRLGQLIRQTEEDFALARCQRHSCAENTQCRLGDACLIRRALYGGLEAFFGALDDYTLADVLAQQHALAAQAARGSSGSPGAETAGMATP